MKRARLQRLSAEGAEPAVPAPEVAPDIDEQEVLDAYSRAVVDVVGAVAPSVVSIRVFAENQRGAVAGVKLLSRPQ